MRSWNDLHAPMTMFDVMDRDTDEVIAIINYYIKRHEGQEEKAAPQRSKQSEVRIRVNDKTATGGWY